MFSKTVLWLFAVLYLGLGLWCAAKPAKTAASVGFSLNGSHGQSEFIVVYGGLELAMGVFFAICAWFSGYREAGLVFALLSSGTLMLFRAYTVATLHGLPRSVFILFGTEVALTVLAAIAWKAS